MKAQWSLWQVLAALGQLETQRGQAELAGEFHSRARELVESIAARAPAEYRDSFLQRAARQLDHEF
jgi:hypothetical protein